MTFLAGILSGLILGLIGGFVLVAHAQKVDPCSEILDRCDDLVEMVGHLIHVAEPDATTNTEAVLGDAPDQ